METFKAIEDRWGCRKYTSKDVEKELLGAVLDAGRYAPSAGNLQDRSFIVVRNDEARTEVATFCGNQTWMQEAPVHIIVVSENKKDKKFFGDRGDTLYSIQDTSFAIQNMLIAATDLELGCSVVVGFDEQHINDALGIEAPATAHAIITLGHPAEEPRPSKKYPLERFVFFERYNAKIENPALALGDWSTVWQQKVHKYAKEIKHEAPGIIEKIKSLFKRKKKEGEDKKEDMVVEDHFLEMPEKEDKELEIPRQLPPPNQN